MNDLKKVLKIIYYIAIIVGTIMIIFSMFYDSANTKTAEDIGRIGLYALIGGIILMIPLIISDKMKRK